MGCGYEGTHFGASYPDAVCIDGHLWDLDSYDGGMLTSGGEKPCPSCNLDAFVASFMEDAELEALNADTPTEPATLLARWLFTGRVFELHGLGGFAAAARQGQLRPVWFGGQGYDQDLDNAPLGRIAWPWPLEDSLSVSAHLLLEAAAIAGDPGPRFATTPEGWRLAPLEGDDWS